MVKFAAPKPAGSVDIRNEPWLLDTAPWGCGGQGDCRGTHSRNLVRSRKKERRSGQAGTVETQAQGLSVVRAAAEFAGRRSR